MARNEHNHWIDGEIELGPYRLLSPFDTDVDPDDIQLDFQNNPQVPTRKYGGQPNGTGTQGGDA